MELRRNNNPCAVPKRGYPMDKPNTEDPAMNAGTVEQDLQFVKRVVQRRRERRSGASVYVIWGVLALIGWPLLDFAPKWEGLYWLIASPLGFILCWILGKRER